MGAVFTFGPLHHCHPLPWITLEIGTSGTVHATIMHPVGQWLPEPACCHSVMAGCPTGVLPCKSIPKDSAQHKVALAAPCPTTWTQTLPCSAMAAPLTCSATTPKSQQVHLQAGPVALASLTPQTVAKSARSALRLYRRVRNRVQVWG